MARIRGLKPDFFRSVSIAKLSWGARLTFQGLWCYADDDGRYRYEPALVKADIWPLDDDVTAKDAEQMVTELEANGQVCLYTVEGRGYLHVVNWHHQKIDRKGQSRNPPCPKDTHGSPPPPRALDEPSANSQRASSEPSDVDLGSRITDLGEGSNTVVEQARPDSLIQAVFDAWVASFPDATRRDLTPARRDAVKAALKRYPLEDVVDAARGWVNDPWPERAQQNDLAQLLHMGTRRKPLNVLEKMRDLWRHGPPQVMGKRTQEMARNATGLRTALRALEGGRSDA